VRTAFPDRPLFGRVSTDALRTVIIRACKAASVPIFTLNDLGNRRISLLHGQGRSWAEIGQLVGQRRLSTTADLYTQVMADGREVNYVGLIAA
jgi:hypothetical protein